MEKTVFLLLPLLLLLSIIKFDTFPINGIEGNIIASYQAVSEFTTDLTFPEAVAKLKTFKYQYDLGNIITLPDVFLQRKAGDCDEFAILNAFIAKQYGYKAFIVYIKFDFLLLHYSTIIYDGKYYKVVDYWTISKPYTTIDATKEFFEKRYNKKTTYLKVISFEEFLQILLK